MDFAPFDYLIIGRKSLTLISNFLLISKKDQGLFLNVFKLIEFPESPSLAGSS